MEYLILYIKYISLGILAFILTLILYGMIKGILQIIFGKKDK